MSRRLAGSPPHRALTRSDVLLVGSDGGVQLVTGKDPVAVEFTFPMRLHVRPLSVESSSVMEVAGEVVAMGSPVTAFVSVPVMFVRPLFRETIVGLSLTVASVGVGYFTE